MAITPLPSAPQISDSPTEFNTKAFAWVDALDQFTTEANALGTQVDADAAQVALDADESAAASAASVAAANYKGEWSTLTGALAIPASVSHNGAVWVLTVSLADVTADEPGAGSPSAWLIVTLPAQSGNAGKALFTDGDQTSWEIVPDDVKIGTLQYFAGATTSTYPGEEWLLCDGSVLTQTAYPDLYNIVGNIANGQDTFTVSAPPFATSGNALTYGDNLYVVAGTGGLLSTSTDAITWTGGTSGVTTLINGLTYGNGVYVYCGAAGVIRSSTNAITWTSRSSGTTTELKAALYANGLYLVAGRGGFLATSTNAENWTPRTTGTSSIFHALAYGNGVYLAGGINGVLRRSTDGDTWTTVSYGSSNDIFALTYGNEIFVAGGNASSMRTSTDGITWAAGNSGLTLTTFDILAITYADGLYAYVGESTLHYFATSYDAKTWKTDNLGVNDPIFALTYGDNLIVSSGNADILTCIPYLYNRTSEFVTPTTITTVIDSEQNLFIKAEE